MGDLEFAHELADRASALALPLFEAGVVMSAKRDGTPVSAADHCVEDLLRELIAAEFPADGFMGEESGGVRNRDRTWIVDPIDGTWFFGRGNPRWRVQIALEVRGEIAVAVVAAPALRSRWWASRGGGAFEKTPTSDQAIPLRVSGTASLAHVVVGAFPPHVLRDITPLWHQVDASSMAPVEVVRGEIDVYLVDSPAPWDHAPWVLLVEESGGCFTSWSGGRQPDHGGVFSNGLLHDSVCAALGVPRPEPLVSSGRVDL